MFTFLGDLIARTRGGALGVFVATMIAVAAVTAVLNLDTAIVFMTPVAVRAARSSRSDESAFLYGTIMMTNSASLLFYGSNLTNLLVFSSRSVTGASFASHMLIPWICSVALTILVVIVWRWRWIRAGSAVRSNERCGLPTGLAPLTVLASVVAMLIVRDPAVPVLVIGLVAATYEVVVKRRLRFRQAVVVASPFLLGPLFVLAVLVGWLGRGWHRVGHLVAHTSSLVTSLIGAGASLVINNLPAASLFSGESIAHPYALLLGLNLGPNFFVTGSLSCLLWFRLARSADAHPSIRTFSMIGFPIALLTILVGSLFV